MKPSLTETGGGSQRRPHCLRCRREMISQGPRRWRCKGCGGSCLRTKARRRYAPTPADRPHCVSCRRPMKADGAGRVGCRRCRVWLTTRPKKLHRFDVTQRPDCPDCGHTMAVGSDGFTCCRCRTERRRVRSSADRAAALLAQLARSLPAHLTPEEREDAAQSIMLDILAGKLAPVVPGPIVLRRYAAGARGMSTDRYRFISLSAPMHDGREFGETLAA